MNARQLGEVLLQQLIGANNQVFLFVALNQEVRHLQVAIDQRGEPGIHWLHLKGIRDGHGIEHGLKVMVTVRPALHHVQTQINLTVRK